MKTLLFATNNQHKLAEAQEILRGYIIEQAALELPELQGDHHLIAREKALAAFRKLGKPVFVEDVALAITAWKGMPGPYTKYFEHCIGNENIWKMLQAFPDKSAKAISLIAFCPEDNAVELFKGIVEGTIVAPRGNLGWGFDPIFQPKNAARTFGEMVREEKCKISHRNKALNLFKQWLEEYYGN